MPPRSPWPAHRPDPEFSADNDAGIGRITGIVIQKTPFKRAAIMVDGHLAVYARPRDAERLRTGDAISGGALAELHRCYQDYGAYRQAVRFLSARDRSVREVRQHVRTKGWETAASDRAVERLQAEGYLDDHAFARRWVDTRCRTAPRSRLAVIQELKQKGVPRDAIDAAVARMDEAALALACTQKKARQWVRYGEDEKERRIVVFLQRKGFSYAVGRKAAQAYRELTKDD